MKNLKKLLIVSLMATAPAYGVLTQEQRALGVVKWTHKGKTYEVACAKELSWRGKLSSRRVVRLIELYERIELSGTTRRGRVALIPGVAEYVNPDQFALVPYADTTFAQPTALTVEGTNAVVPVAYDEPSTSKSKTNKSKKRKREDDANNTFDSDANHDNETFDFGSGDFEEFFNDQQADAPTHESKRRKKMSWTELFASAKDNVVSSTVSMFSGFTSKVTGLFSWGSNNQS